MNKNKPAQEYKEVDGLSSSGESSENILSKIPSQGDSEQLDFGSPRTVSLSTPKLVDSERNPIEF